MSKINIKIKLKANKSDLIPQTDGSYIAYIRSAPIDNKANIELFDLLSDYFNVAKRDIIIISGIKSINKVIEIL